MQPTKLPDDLFPDAEWRAAPYGERVAYLVRACMAAQQVARTMASERELLLAELRECRANIAAMAERIEQLTTRQKGAGD